MSQDRREHKRFAVRWRGRMAYNKTVSDVDIRDVSKGGVCILFPYLITVGTPVSIEFYIKYRGEMTRLRAKCRVSFNTMLAANSGAKLGLQFLAMAKDESHVLANVLHLLEDQQF